MASSNRPLKKARLITSPIDRISSLPDEILELILSFMCTRQAVQTSVLSKRWRNLWAHVTVLNLEINEFLPERYELVLTTREIEAREVNFREFVEGVLRYRAKLRLDTFRLEWSTKQWSKYCTSAFVEMCVLYAIKFKARKLSIHVPKFNLWNMSPDQTFASSSLEEISLMFRTNDMLEKYQDIEASVISFPRLKRLEIAFVLIEDEYLNKLLSGCPALEELDLCECVLDTSKICSTVLNTLVLHHCITEQKLELSTHNIMHLKIVEPRGEEIYWGRLPSLVDACISFPGACCYDDIAINLHNLSNATRLDLTFEYIPIATIYQYIQRVQQDDDVKFPAFKNLRSLVLGNMGGYNFDLVVLFLQYSPNLQALTLRHLKGYFDNVLRRCPHIWKIVSLSLEHLCLNCHINGVGSFLEHLPMLQKLALSYVNCKRSNQHRPLEVAPFRCDHLEEIELEYFSQDDDEFPQVVKYMHDGLKGKLTELIHCNLEG